MHKVNWNYQCGKLIDLICVLEGITGKHDDEAVIKKIGALEPIKKILASKQEEDEWGAMLAYAVGEDNPYCGEVVRIHAYQKATLPTPTKPEGGEFTILQWLPKDHPMPGMVAQIEPPSAKIAGELPPVA